jgi:hypothetical protein
MDESTQTLLIPCRYHRFCNGYLNPAAPLQGNLCPDCFESIDDGYEQVEQEERADQLAAEAQRDAS